MTQPHIDNLAQPATRNLNAIMDTILFLTGLEMTMQHTLSQMMKDAQLTHYRDQSGHVWIRDASGVVKRCKA